MYIVSAPSSAARASAAAVEVDLEPKVEIRRCLFSNRDDDDAAAGEAGAIDVEPPATPTAPTPTGSSRKRANSETEKRPPPNLSEFEDSAQVRTSITFGGTRKAYPSSPLFSQL